MSYRFFYIGPRNVNLLLQDTFRRANEVKLISNRLRSYDIVPDHEEHNRLSGGKYASLVREVWKDGPNTILFYDNGFDQSQREQLSQALNGSSATIYPLKRPLETREECDRAGMMMMSTPLWTHAYVRQMLHPDDAVLAELDRLIAERDDLTLKVQTSVEITAEPRTITQIVQDAKDKYSDQLLITETTEKSAASCRFSKADVAEAAIAAIASYVSSLAKDANFNVDLNEYFRAKGFHFAPTNTGATKAQNGDDYAVPIGDVKLTTHMHLKKGSFRIYFAIDKKRAIIGAIGDHLPTAGYQP